MTPLPPSHDGSGRPQQIGARGAEVAQPVRERVDVTLARQAAVRVFVPITDASFDALIEGLGASCRAKVAADWKDC